jgi:hypothetical protein
MTSWNLPASTTSGFSIPLIIIGLLRKTANISSFCSMIFFTKGGKAYNPIFLDIFARQDQIEHTVVTGTISGRRDRGRQREKILDGLANWLGVKSITEMINKTRDRNGWRYMTTNVCRQGT